VSDATTGVASIDAAAVWCGAVVALSGGAALLWRISRAARRLAHRIDEFADDWQGTEPRPGVPGRSGVMARLDAIERQGAATAARVERIEHELHPNSGSSLRDALDRVEQHFTDPE
jgi:hypothetical protein